MARDNFSKEVIKTIAERAAYLCSNPDCRMITTGPHSDEKKSLKTGIAAHICAASEGGPRFDPNQTKEERSSIKNAIWLCHSCSDLVDKDTGKYTKEVLLNWKSIHDNFISKERGKNYSNCQQNYMGGNGGKIFIFAQNIEGDGLITANGGNGLIGGSGGEVHIISDNNNFKGKISASGGESKILQKDKILFFEEIWLKTTGAQLRFLEVLRESMRNNGRGMDCGYVSNYFQNIIGKMTDRYRGWITPFIVAYIQEKGIVVVSDNFFSITNLGEDFLDYIEQKGYKIKDKEL